MRQVKSNVIFGQETSGQACEKYLRILWYSSNPWVDKTVIDYKKWVAMRLKGGLFSMKKPLYQVVFKGEIFPGYDRTHVIQRVKDLCKYDDATLMKLFSGKTYIIKDRIERQQAQKYKSVLEETGIICHTQALE